MYMYMYDCYVPRLPALLKSYHSASHTGWKGYYTAADLELCLVTGLSTGPEAHERGPLGGCVHVQSLPGMISLCISYAL